MKNKINKFIYILAFAATISFVGCADDIDPEVTSIEFDRLFAPIDLDVTINNRTDARVKWKAVENATTYDLEVFDNSEFDFTGTPIRSATGITMDQLPYAFTGFDFETTYSLRVKAYGDDMPESKWAPLKFTTEQEQIFTPIITGELLTTEVTLRWKAGETATVLILTPDLTPEDAIEYILTEEDLAASFVKFSDLTRNTQ